MCIRLQIVSILLVYIYLKTTESTFVGIGDYDSYNIIDVNLPECGLRYVPRNYHKLTYSSKCFGNSYENRTKLDYTSRPYRRGSGDLQPIMTMPTEPTERGTTTKKLPKRIPSHRSLQKAFNRRQFRQSSKRIYSGTDAEIGESPWSVFLRRGYKAVKFGTCTGTLITFEWVLTAARCVHDLSNFTEIAIFSRPAIMEQSGTGQQKIMADLDKIFLHPKYDWEEYHDIALIKTHKKFLRHSNDGRNYMINTICLPESGKYNLQKDTALVFGFGAFGEFDKWKIYRYSKPLRKTIVNLEPTPTDANIDKSHMRAKIGKDQPHICQGDYGSSLIQYVDPLKYRAVLVGVASIGPTSGLSDDINWDYYLKCDDSDTEDHYTSVSLNVDWILKTIDEN